MNMKVDYVLVSETYSPVFDYYPYGTILWLKQKNGVISQIKVVGIELGKLESGNNTILHTYMLPNGMCCKGYTTLTELGCVRASLEEAKQYGWDDTRDITRENLKKFRKWGDFAALIAKQYHTTEEILKWGGKQYAMLYGYSLNTDGTCVQKRKNLHFDIAFDKNKEIVISVEEFDNKTSFPSMEEALNGYQYHIETFSDSEEYSEEDTNDGAVIAVHNHTLELLDFLGINYEKINS